MLNFVTATLCILILISLINTFIYLCLGLYPPALKGLLGIGLALGKKVYPLYYISSPQNMNLPTLPFVLSPNFQSNYNF